MGLVRVLAWPEGWSPLQGCAHPGPSPAAVGDLARLSRCNPGQSTTQGQGCHKRPPAPAGRWPEPPQWHLLCAAPQVGALQDVQLKSLRQWGSCHPHPAGTWAAEPRSGCSSNGLIPAETGSKAGADLDGVLLNNGEGARSLLLARKTCVFQSIGFWE